MTGPATTRGVTLAALMAVLGRPTWWALALAGFLIRGGLVLFLLAIVTLPSPLALSNVLAPIITPLYFGHVDAGTVALLGSGIGAAIAWLVAGSWFAAATEVVLVRDAQVAAADDGLPSTTGRGGRLLVTRATAAHFVALIPLVLAAVGGSVAILDVTYRELVNPSDADPIVLRVISGSVGPVAVIVVAWLFGELVGGAAARRVILRDESILGAVGGAALDLVRRPAGSLLMPLLTTAILALDLLALLLVVTIVWTDVRDKLSQAAGDPVGLGLSLLTFGGAWWLALIVTALIAAWRSVAMTYEAERAAVRSSAPQSRLVAGGGYA